MALAEEDMISGSVGFVVKSRQDRHVDRRSMTRRIMKSFLDHLSMVESPAYKGAETVAVHDVWTPHPAAGEQPLRTPALDEYLADDVLSWAKSRVSGK